MKSQVLHTVWCYISGEAASGVIWNWSLLGVKGLICRWIQITRSNEDWRGGESDFRAIRRDLTFIDLSWKYELVQSQRERMKVSIRETSVVLMRSHLVWSGLQGEWWSFWQEHKAVLLNPDRHNHRRHHHHHHGHHHRQRRCRHHLRRRRHHHHRRRRCVNQLYVAELIAILLRVSCYSSGLLWENHFHAQKKGRQFPGHTVRHYRHGSQPGGQRNRPEGQTAGSGARARRTRVEHQHSSTTGSGSSSRRQPRPSARRAEERGRVVSCGDGCGDQAGERVGHPPVWLW